MRYDVDFSEDYPPGEKWNAIADLVLNKKTYSTREVADTFHFITKKTPVTKKSKTEKTSRAKNRAEIAKEKMRAESKRAREERNKKRKEKANGKKKRKRKEPEPVLDVMDMEMDMDMELCYICRKIPAGFCSRPPPLQIRQDSSYVLRDTGEGRSTITIVAGIHFSIKMSYLVQKLMQKET